MSWNSLFNFKEISLIYAWNLIPLKSRKSNNMCIEYHSSNNNNITMLIHAKLECAIFFSFKSVSISLEYTRIHHSRGWGGKFFIEILTLTWTILYILKLKIDSLIIILPTSLLEWEGSTCEQLCGQWTHHVVDLMWAQHVSLIHYIPYHEVAHMGSVKLFFTIKGINMPPILKIFIYYYWKVNNFKKCL